MPKPAFRTAAVVEEAADVHPYAIAGATDFDTWLTSKYWGLVVVDASSNVPVGGFGELVSFLNAGGRATVSTWRLTDQADLCAAFGVTAAETSAAVAQHPLRHNAPLPSPPAAQPR